MNLPILDCARSLYLRHTEEMHHTQKGSLFKQAAPKTLPPNKNKKKEDNAVQVRSRIPQRKNQENQVHQNEGILVKTTRENSYGEE